VRWRKRLWRCREPACPTGTFTETHELAGARSVLTISRALISVIENGGNGMNLVRLYRLARALSVEPWELLNSRSSEAGSN
jgi:transcriptional regulator with XRE-family HTH domain